MTKLINQLTTYDIDFFTSKMGMQLKVCARWPKKQVQSIQLNEYVRALPLICHALAASVRL